MASLKFINLEYKDSEMLENTIVLFALCTLEFLRIHLGRKGSLSDHGIYQR